MMTWWRDDMETISTLLTLCERNSSVTGRFASQRASRPIAGYDDIFDANQNKLLSTSS